MLIDPVETVWPTSLVGYLGIAGTFCSLVGTAFAWGRWTQKTSTIKKDLTDAFENHKDHVKLTLDGFGGRMDTMESEHDHVVGRLEEASGHVQRLLGQHDTILGLLGEARGNAVRCSEDTVALGEKIEKKLEGVTREVADTKLELSSRLAGVERELELARRKP